MKNRGRPKKYSDEYCLELFELNKNGMNSEQIARKFKLATSTTIRLIKIGGNGVFIKNKIYRTKEHKNSISIAQKNRIRIKKKN